MRQPWTGDAIGASRFEVVDAATDHPNRIVGKKTLAENERQQIDFAMARVFQLVAADGGKKRGQFERFENTHRGRFVFRGADVERKPMLAKHDQHVARTPGKTELLLQPSRV